MSAPNEDDEEFTDHDALLRRNEVAMAALEALRRPATRETIEKLETDWHLWFHAMNVESTPQAKAQRLHRRQRGYRPRQDAVRFSPSDMTFVALCHFAVREEDAERKAAVAATAPECKTEDDGADVAATTPPRRRVEIADELGWQWLIEAHVWLVVVASQHTPESLAWWPSAEQWRDIKRRIARVVITFVMTGPITRRANVDNLDAMVALTAFDAMVNQTLYGMYNSRRRPAALLATKARRKADRAAANAMINEAYTRNNEPSVLDTSDETVSAEAQGALWRNSAIDLLGDFVRVASRTVHVVDLHARLDAMFPRAPPEDTPRFTEAVLEHACTWVRIKCDSEQTGDTRKLFRDTANTWWLPLGAHTAKYRERRTRTDHSAPLPGIEAELGLDIAMHLNDMSTKVDLADIAAGHPLAATPHQMWEPLLLTLVDNVARNELAMHFARDYVVHEPIEAFEALRTRLTRTLFRAMPARPVIVRVQRQWRVLRTVDDGRRRVWYAPEHGLIGAILTWLHFVLVDFDDQDTEDGLSVCGLAAHLFGELRDRRLVPSGESSSSAAVAH